MKKIFFLLAAAAMMFAACNPDQKEETKAATVELSAGDVTTSSVTFTVTSANATAVAYVCVEGAAPAGDKVLTDGKAVEANTAATVTVDGLKDGVEYTIVAAAMNEVGVVASEPLKMTTVEIPANPQVTITEVSSTDKAFTFTITPSDAAKCAYKVYAEGETASADDILSTGVEVSATSEEEVTVENLEDGNYFVAAAVENGDKKAMSETLSFSVANMEVMFIDNFYDSYKKYYYAPDLGVQLKYRDELGHQCDVIFEINVGSDAYCIPEGTYSSDEGTVNLEYSNHKLYPYGWMDMPDYSSTYNFDYCKLTVEHGEDGLYIIKGEALQWDSFYEYLEPPYNVKTVTKLVWEYHGDLPGFSIM